MHQIFQCIQADFKQRTRQNSFVVTLMAMSVLTLLFFPSPDSQYQTLVINGYRGIYNSAWLGASLAMLNVLFLPLICFYLIKNALELDRKSMTGELIAATSVTKLNFLIAKWFTNVLILVSIVVIMLINCLVIQIYYGESYHINLWALVWPQIVFVLPILLAISGLSLMFESIKWLKGGLGNVVYFFLWVGAIVHSVESVSGVGALLEHIEREVEQRFPLQQGPTNIGINISEEVNDISTFVWQGIEPSLLHLWGALPLLIISLTCLVMAFIFFDRFSNASMSEHMQPSKLSKMIKHGLGNNLDKLFINFTKHFAFTRLLRLELKLQLKSLSVYWYIVVFALNIIQLFISHQLLVSLVLPISWLWCVLVISQLGQMEKQYNTIELITYSNKSMVIQSAASCSAAWILLVLVSLGSLIRFVGSAEWLLVIQLIIAVSFTVALAYCCGVLTGTKRVFEVLYPALWYMGPIQGALYIDFFGVNPIASWQASVPFYFLMISISLVILTISVKSKRQTT
ncbi:hypothetical protein [Thalassotalea ganghwensis]